MKNIILVALLLLSGAEAALAASCGPVNYGALPNNGHYYCYTETVPRYDRCGNSAGVLQGLKNHTLMCGSSSFNVVQAWQPKPESVQLCNGVAFDQCATLGSTTRCRKLYSQNPGWTWSPSRGSQCDGETFTQTSNCGETRERTGTKDCGCTDSWSPSRDSICIGETFTQTSSCGGTRERTGRMECEVEPEIDINEKDPRTVWTTTPQGDEGYFQFNGTETSIMVIYNDNQDNIVRRYRSTAGHPYKVWIDDNEPGGWPLNLVTRNYFDMWINYIDEVNPSSGSEYHPNKHWCELVENIWSPWVTDPIPTDCGVHTYQRRRTCSQQGAANPCPFSCPNGSMNQTVVENLTVNNGACPPPDPDPDPGSDPGWDHTTTANLDPSLWTTTNMNGRLCNGWRNGTWGEDKRKKMERHDSGNLGADYACSNVGETDFCFTVFSEGSPNNIQEVEQTNFRCQ